MASSAAAINVISEVSDEEEIEHENSDKGHDDITTEDMTMTPKKKKKRMQKYRKEYTESYKWVSKVNGDCYKAYCNLCHCKFTIAHGGANDLKQHEKTKKHEQEVREAATKTVITKFFPSSTDDSEKKLMAKIIAAEAVSAYHCCKHNISYASQDCANKLYCTQFPDSNIAKKFSTGRTKMEAIVTSVLAPQSVSDAIHRLQEKDIPFSIASDASNWKHRKMFPILVKYFDPDEGGIQSKLIDFYEDPKEDASSIANALKSKITGHGLRMANITAYAADNANVNFGRHHSVYELLKKESPTIIKANCCAHIVHNTLKHALEQIYTVDVENVVIRTFNYFSSSAKRTDELKAFFEFVDLEWAGLLRHVPTRWLSLGPAVDRLLKGFPAVISYFRSINNAPAIHRLLKIDIRDDRMDECNIVETVLSFISNVIPIFTEAVLKVESEVTSATEVYDIISKLHGKLQQCKEDCFYGFQASNLLRSESMPLPSKRRLEAQFVAFYNESIAYLERSFNFSEDITLCLISPVALEKELPTYAQLCNMVQTLLLKDIEMDSLYEEVCVLRNANISVCTMVGSVYEKWQRILSGNPCPNICKIVSCVLSIPSSNASAERVFSYMNAKWTDTRNRASVLLIKSELMVSHNYKLSCAQMHRYVLSDKAIQKKLKSVSKYDFKE